MQHFVNGIIHRLILLLYMDVLYVVCLVPASKSRPSHLISPPDTQFLIIMALNNPFYQNRVWSYDIVSGRTGEGRAVRYLNIPDEYSWESLKIYIDRRITADDVLEQPAG